MNKIIEKAMEIKKYSERLPVVEIGEIVTLGDIWDGEGEIPEGSYSYWLTDEGEDGEDRYPVYINYCFLPVIQAVDFGLESEIIITNIELI